MDLKQFEEWFEEPIERLSKYDHSGFAVLMIALPLAERYFRILSRTGDGSLQKPFYEKFVGEFSNLEWEQAKDFWHRYRNGLLHQGTLFPEIGGALISSAPMNAPHIINFDRSNGGFLLKPMEFARKIVEIIKADYPTFEITAGRLFPLSQVTGVPEIWAMSGDSSSMAGATGNPALPRP